MYDLVRFVVFAFGLVSVLLGVTFFSVPILSHFAISSQSTFAYLGCGLVMFVSGASSLIYSLTDRAWD